MHRSLLLTLFLVPFLAACGDSSSDKVADSGIGDDIGVSDDIGVADSVPAEDGAVAEDAEPDAVSTACTQPPKQFWTWNLAAMPPTDVQVSATCRAQTAHAYIYVADDVWGTDMTQEAVDNVVQAFEQQTPRDSTRGIYATDTDTFGQPPDIDGDPHIYLFYLNIPGYQGYAFDGYFRDVDETNDPTSNHVEMVQLNASGSNAPDSDYMLGVLIHEFVHLIGSQYDGSEEGWLNESLAESAMTLGGYLTDLPAGKDYLRVTATTPLVVKGTTDYGADFMFGSYLLDRFSPDMLKALLQDPAHGLTSLDAQLANAGLSFHDVFGDFMVANLLDAPSLESGQYGYESIDAAALGHETTAVIDGAEHASSVVAWGARFLKFAPAQAGTLQLQLTATDYAKLVVRSVTLDPQHPEAAMVTAHELTDATTSLTIPVAAGEIVDLVVAADWGSALSELNGAATVSFSYQATLAQ